MSRAQRILVLGMLGAGLVFLAVGAALFWRQSRGATMTGIASGEILAAGGAPAAMRLEVATTGLMRVPAAALSDVGLLDGPLNGDHVALTRDGSAVPYFVAGTGRDAALFFYATAADIGADRPVVYWLAPGTGQVMETLNAAPDGPGVDSGEQQWRWDENHIFVALAESDDPWFGVRLFSPGDLSSWETTLQLPPTSGPATLALRLWSNNGIRDIDPDHHVAVYLNETLVAEHSWDDLALETVAVTVPAGVLRAGENSVRVALPGDTGAPGEDVYLDWITLDYSGTLSAAAPLRFSSSAPTVTLQEAADDLLVVDVAGEQPRLLDGLRVADGSATLANRGGGSYIAASAAAVAAPSMSLVPRWEPLRAAERGADYLVISADAADFEEALQPLLSHRAAQGYTTALVNVRQVYDEFGFGRETPAAIRSFLAFAAAGWSPAPRFVLLVGDASYDVNGYTAGQNHNLLPTQLIYTEHAGYVASDTWYVLPAAGDPVPQMAIGRLPVHGKRDLETMVAKILDYENGTSGTWTTRALLVADDEEAFTRVSSELAGELSVAGYTPQALYMEENEDIHSAIVGAFNGGVGLVNYVGHGSVGVWGDERVLTTEDAPELTNARQYPIFVTFTCLNGYFNHPDVDALAEALLRVDGGGVVAAIAPSGRSFTAQQEPIANAFYALLLQSEARTLGEALQFAKQEGAGNAFLLEVIHTFNLLGDPALRFRLPGS